MPWKTSLIDSEVEKEILTGLITDPRYIKEIQSVFRPQLLQIPYGKTIARWCFDYYKKYKKAPGNVIQDLYNNYSNEKKADPAQIELIGKFLSGLSRKHERKGNVKYNVDKAVLYFRTRDVELLKEDLSALLLTNKIDEAEKRIKTFKRVEIPKTVGIDIVRDNVVQILFSEDDELFTFPGALGEMMGKICREDYVLFVGPGKRGKSWWLQEFGLRAMFRNLNVIYYSLEMSEKKMLRRIYQYFTGEPKNAKTIDYPYFTKQNEVEYRSIEKKGMTVIEIKKKQKQIEHMLNKNSFRLNRFPSGSINVDDMKTHLDNLESYEKFIPDVIIVDHPDIMAPERESSREERHKINATQLALRGLAQERSCAVIAAAHTDRSTFKNNIGEDSISEDIRKLWHATHVVALNQSREDKKGGIQRLSMLVARDDEFHVEDEIIVLQCLPIGKICLDSRWAKDIEGL